MGIHGYERRVATQQKGYVLLRKNRRASFRILRANEGMNRVMQFGQSWGRLLLLLGFLAALLLQPARNVYAQESATAVNTMTDLVAREAQLLYLANVERDQAGVPPLRWNRELSEAARWFSKDSIDSETPSCDHLDSNGEGLGLRMRRFGYQNPVAFGELIVCGFVEPDAAIYGWRINPDRDYYQYQLLLDTRFREAGVAYHYNEQAGRGMVVLNISGDKSYAPVVINLEAPSTTDPNVSLYIYPTQNTPVSIKISSSPTFAGAEWQPYAERINWTLPEGTGWRSVYVLTRDIYGATSLASDTIWLGDGLPTQDISLDQATSIGVGYTIDALPADQGEKVRFSLGWELDDGDGAYTIYRGAADTVNDASAVGGTALRLRDDGRETRVLARFTDLPANRILTLYVRAKVSDTGGSDVIAEITAVAGALTFGPLRVRPIDFSGANQWQEFALNFILPTGTEPSHVDLTIAHTGAVRLWLDTTRVYSQPVDASQQIIWPAGDASVRGQAVQARFETDGVVGEPFDIAYTAVDSIAPTDQSQTVIDASPSALTFASMQGVVDNQGQVVLACAAWCSSVQWQARVQEPWLRVLEAQEGLIVYFEPAGLQEGAYQTTIFLSPKAEGTGQIFFPNLSGRLLQTWVLVYVTVDGATPLPPQEVKQSYWLPLARQR